MRSVEPTPRGCFGARLVLALTLGLLGLACASPATDAAVVAPPTSALAGDVARRDGGAVVARLAAAVRVWNNAREGLRSWAVGEVTASGVSVVEGGRGLRLGPTDATHVLVVRASDLPACTDREAGVVVGEPVRVLGCGAHGLAGLAIGMGVVMALPTASVAVVLGEDDDDIDALLPSTTKDVWVVDGPFSAGADADVLDVVVVEPAWLDVGIRSVTADVDRLVIATGRVVAWKPLPRLPRVVVDRLAVLPSSGPLGFGRPDARALGAEPTTEALVVDRCNLVDFPGARDAATVPARVRCRVLPGRPLARVVDDLVRVIDDADVLVEVERGIEPSATAWDAPLARAIREAVQAASPRAIMAPALASGPVPSPCAVVRWRGIPCIGALPLLAHPALLARRGMPDESVDAQALERALSTVVDVVDRLDGSAVH
jgi:hypothetical protein